VSRRRIILRREVPADLLDIHDYIARDSPEAAQRFLDSAQATLEELARMPGLGSLKPFRGKLKGIRSRPVRGFPNHLVYYKPTEAAISVLAILHGAQSVQRVLRGRRP
jgi:toxin ParE1/3/4